MLQLSTLRYADIAAYVLMALRDDDNMKSLRRRRAPLGEFHALFHCYSAVFEMILYMDVDPSTGRLLDHRVRLGGRASDGTSRSSRIGNFFDRNTLIPIR